MEGNIITWDDGWDYLEKGIIKMKRRLKGLPEPPFNPGEYRIINTVVQKMCTQMPPHDYSQRLYDEYRKVFEEYMIKTVLRSLEKKHDESLLRELKRKWQNNKEMVTVLSRFFHFLNQIDEERDQIDEEREGQQIDRTLLKDVIDIYVKIGMGQMECYEHDFEEDMLQDSGAYYSRKASNWIVDKAYSDYISKTDECLQREKDRVTHYLHRSSEQKLVEKVQHELLVVYARHLLRDDKHVTDKGVTLVQQAENAARSEAANGVGVQIQALKEAFEVICNKTDAGSPSAERLSTLCNDILKKGGSEKLGDEAREETLRKYSEEMKQKFKKLRRNGGC